jgi:DNA-binding helix-hairpin-helix protein with protein kinase domain
MIQINLIPDVKREFIHAQKMRRATISISILVGIAAVGIIIALALVLGSQAIYQATLSSSIDSEYKKLSGTENINTALTIQNQLQTVSSLNGKKSIDSRLLDVLAAINPAAPNDT